MRGRINQENIVNGFPQQTDATAEESGAGEHPRRDVDHRTVNGKITGCGSCGKPYDADVGFKGGGVNISLASTAKCRSNVIAMSS